MLHRGKAIRSNIFQVLKALKHFPVERNRRASVSLSPVLIHFLAPHGKLSQKLLALEHLLGSIPPLLSAQEHPDQKTLYGILALEWPTVQRLLLEKKGAAASGCR